MTWLVLRLLTYTRHLVLLLIHYNLPSYLVMVWTIILYYGLLNHLSRRRQHVVLDHTFSDLGYSDEKGAAGIYFRFIAVLNLYEWSSWKHVSSSDSFVCWWYCYVCDAVVPIQACINSDLALLSQWATTNGFRINKSK